MNGIFLIKDETLTIEGEKAIHTYKACGDIGWAKEIQYIRVQMIIDNMVNKQ